MRIALHPSRGEEPLREAGVRVAIAGRRGLRGLEVEGDGMACTGPAASSRDGSTLGWDRISSLVRPVLSSTFRGEGRVEEGLFSGRSSCESTSL
jgi:hypothetical protein